MHTKRFLDWITVKANLHFGGNSPNILEGEVWWCSYGENIGVEMNGKGARFSRPVLVLRKFSHQGFLGVPLTSQEKEGTWFVKFELLGKIQYAVLSQTRTLSVLRLHSKIGRIPEPALMVVKAAYRDLFQ